MIPQLLKAELRVLGSNMRYWHTACVSLARPPFRRSLSTLSGFPGKIKKFLFSQNLITWSLVSVLAALIVKIIKAAA